MTLSPRAIEAAARALRERDMSGRITVPWEKMPKGQRKKWIERGEAALTAALAVDGLCLVEANEVEKLRSALKGLSDMYTHAWDLAEGGLMMMESSMDRFEKAHQVAYDVLNPDHPLISDEDDEDDVAAASDGDSPRKTEG